jgi:hypothetical protein
MRAPSIPAVERALYDDRSVVRILGMRRTLFVVPVELIEVIHAACTRAIAATERRRLVQLLSGAGIGDARGKWLQNVERATIAALIARGEATATELAADVPDLRRQFLYGEGKKWEGMQSVSTRLLFLLAADGAVVRGRPRGSWISTQYKWAPVETWVPDGPRDTPAEEARVELARRWLTAYGPGTVADLKWWTGWTVADAKRALAALDVVEVDLDGATGYVLADDTAPVRAPKPWAALLPSLDPTVMGWTGRAWYLGEHQAALFDRSGNAGPTIWWDGRIVGGWAQRPNGEIALRFLEDAGREAVTAVHQRAAELTTLLGERRVVPRFRTPLERELSQS